LMLLEKSKCPESRIPEAIVHSVIASLLKGYGLIEREKSLVKKDETAMTRKAKCSEFAFRRMETGILIPFVLPIQGVGLSQIGSL